MFVMYTSKMGGFGLLRRSWCGRSHYACLHHHIIPFPRHHYCITLTRISFIRSCARAAWHTVTCFETSNFDEIDIERIMLPHHQSVTCPCPDSCSAAAAHLCSPDLVP